MKYIIIIAIIISLAACKKSSPVTPSTPTNPPTQTPSYAQGRIYLPGWGLDTFVSKDSNHVVVDTLYSYSGSNGESYILYNGKQYALWIDTTANKIDTSGSYPKLFGLGIGATINDTSSFIGVFSSYDYPKTKNGKQIPRGMSFDTKIFNKKFPGSTEYWYGLKNQ